MKRLRNKTVIKAYLQMMADSVVQCKVTKVGGNHIVTAVIKS